MTPARSTAPTTKRAPRANAVKSNQNERDYDALVAAEATGRVSVLRGL